MKISRGYLALIIILAVIIIDQAVKIWIKTHFYLGETYEVTSWFKIHFIENNGMAFGWELGSKLLLMLFRIVLTVLLIVYIWKLRHRTDLKVGYMVCLALITAGALGNIIDCAFYGMIFNNPAPPEVATLFPEGGGYGTLGGWRTFRVFPARIQHSRRSHLGRNHSSAPILPPLSVI